MVKALLTLTEKGAVIDQRSPLTLTLFMIFYFESSAKLKCQNMCSQDVELFELFYSPEGMESD